MAQAIAVVDYDAAECADKFFPKLKNNKMFHCAIKKNETEFHNLNAVRYRFIHRKLVLLHWVSQHSILFKGYKSINLTINQNSISRIMDCNNRKTSYIFVLGFVRRFSVM